MANGSTGSILPRPRPNVRPSKPITASATARPPSRHNAGSSTRSSIRSTRAASSPKPWLPSSTSATTRPGGGTPTDPSSSGEPTMLLEGKKVLVAGITSDDSLGFAVAKQAQEHGADIVLTSVGRL